MKKLSIILLAAVFLAACTEGGYNEQLPEGQLIIDNQLTMNEEPTDFCSEPASFPQLQKPPELYLVHAGENVRATQLGASWFWIDEDGTGGGFESDSPHALQLPNRDRAVLFTDGGEVLLQFGDDLPPTSISVQRWLAEYARGEQDINDVIGKNEIVELRDNAILIGSDMQDYVYSVFATFSQGNVTYTFRITSAPEPLIEPLPEDPLPEPPFIHPEMPRSNMLSLTAERDLQIRQNYMAYLPDWWQGVTAEDLMIINYFGAYNGHEVLVIYPREYMNTDDMQYIEIAEHVIALTSGSFRLMVHKDGAFLHITEAHEQGWLIDEDIALIAGQTHG
jgi:hypothetical protein